MAVQAVRPQSGPQIWADPDDSQALGPTVFPDPSLQAAPVLPSRNVFAAAPGGDDAAPALKPLGMDQGPQVFAAPPPPPSVRPETDLEGQERTTNDQLKKLQSKDADPWGSADNHPGFWGKTAHVLGKIGNIAGNVLAPATMELIPGTDLNRQAQEGGLTERLKGLVAADADQKEKAATAAYETQRPQIETARNGMRQGIADDKNKTMLAKAGLMQDEDGNVVADPNSPVLQSRKIHDDVEQSKQSLMEAEEEVKRASVDPNSPAYQLAVQRANTARVNAGAAVQRAQAYYGNYLQHAYNKGLDGEILPGAPQIVGDNGETVTPGSSNAAQAVKANAGAAQFNDVHGALDGLETNARALHADGDAFNSPAITLALRHVPVTSPMATFVQSIDKENLSPAQRAYVIALNAAHEQIQGLRKSAGGGATDSQVANLLAMLPDGSTPDLNYFLNQTKQIRQTADRIGKGAATAKGGLSVRGQHDGGGAPKTQTFVSNGVKYNIPADQVAAFKKDHPDAR